MIIQLLLALFRIIEPARGSIYIDGVDITKLGLRDRSSIFIYAENNNAKLSEVRSAVSIIPQGLFGIKNV